MTNDALLSGLFLRANPNLHLFPHSFDLSSQNWSVCSPTRLNKICPLNASSRPMHFAWCRHYEMVIGPHLVGLLLWPACILFSSFLNLCRWMASQFRWKLSFVFATRLLFVSQRLRLHFVLQLPSSNVTVLNGHCISFSTNCVSNASCFPCSLAISAQVLNSLAQEFDTLMPCRDTMP